MLAVLLLPLSWFPYTAQVLCELTPLQCVLFYAGDVLFPCWPSIIVSILCSPAAWLPQSMYLCSYYLVSAMVYICNLPWQFLMWFSFSKLVRYNAGELLGQILQNQAVFYYFSFSLLFLMDGCLVRFKVLLSEWVIAFGTSWWLPVFYLIVVFTVASALFLLPLLLSVWYSNILVWPSWWYVGPC
jgi:hypothetical protein